MARITIEDCSEHVPNHFTLVLMTAVRSKQLLRGSRAQVPAAENKAVVTALREIAAGLVSIDEAAPVEEPVPAVAPAPAPEPVAPEPATE